MNGMVETLRKVNYARAFYLVLLVTGVILYLLWSLLFDAWTDLGLYSITMMMVGFGLVGYLLYTIAPTGGKK
jgi:hypothetical protein